MISSMRSFCLIGTSVLPLSLEIFYDTLAIPVGYGLTVGRDDEAFPVAVVLYVAQFQDSCRRVGFF